MTYKFINFSSEDNDTVFTEKINKLEKDGWKVISHCTDRYWGLTIIFYKEG